jgi:hypothetical protein
VGQYIDSGPDDTGRYWYVLKDVTKGNPPLFELKVILQATKSEQECNDAIDKAVKLVQAQARKWADAKIL